MQAVGKIAKLVAQLGVPLTYSLPLGEELISLNPYLGKEISLKFTGHIECRGCQKVIKKSYQEGYCFPCTQKLARCDLCILKPTLCHFHLGTCREPQWGETHCMIPHYVYLAWASGVKVGITRTTQIPTRWIDQGATQALLLFEVATRRVSGFAEKKIAQYVSERTDWRKMLKGKEPTEDLLAVRNNLLNQLSKDLKEVYLQFGRESMQLIESPVLYQFEYPILQVPEKINSLSFDKTPLIEGTLLGIKGQYLILDKGVMNVRKHGSYWIEMKSE